MRQSVVPHARLMAKIALDGPLMKMVRPRSVSSRPRWALHATVVRTVPLLVPMVIPCLLLPPVHRLPLPHPVIQKCSLTCTGTHQSTTKSVQAIQTLWHASMPVSMPCVLPHLTPWVAEAIQIPNVPNTTSQPTSTLTSEWFGLHGAENNKN